MKIIRLEHEPLLDVTFSNLKKNVKHLNAFQIYINFFLKNKSNKQKKKYVLYLFIKRGTKRHFKR